MNIGIRLNEFCVIFFKLKFSPVPVSKHLLPELFYLITSDWCFKNIYFETLNLAMV